MAGKALIDHFIFRNCQRQVPEVGERQAPWKERVIIENDDHVAKL